MSKNATEKAITPRQRLALEALALGLTTTQAAKQAAVSRSTVYRWLRDDPVFIAELRRLDSEALAQLGRGVMALSSAAVDAIARALQEGQPMAIRLRAAQLVAERGPALAETQTILSRLEELERRLQ